MGGDFGPPVTLPASIQFLRENPDVTMLLVGDSVLVEPYLRGLEDSVRRRVQMTHTSVHISNESSPAEALRNAKDSSMYLAVDLVKQGEVDACVSGGNTGALLMIGRHLLKTIPGVTKPAIVANIPYPESGESGLLLDVGANINCNARNLQEFAIMGAVLWRVLRRVERPRVALLNIGVEDHKGSDEVREAARLLEDSPMLEFAGYIEGNELFSGRADVIVCDGFAGNLAIKTSEGVVTLMKRVARQASLGSLFFRLLGILLKPFLKSLNDKFDPAQYNGASVLGLQGIIVKSHGNATVKGFERAINQAMHEVRFNVPRVIQEHVATIHVESADLATS
jgi:glycerol-3-phosphate acyltransferase PlsX